MNQRNDSDNKYRAPALAKGLEVIELLASEQHPLKLAQICERLGRTRSEILRMVLELENFGYLEKSSISEGYELTSKMFFLGLKKPTTKSLLETALPIMRMLSLETQQTCHIAVPSGEHSVIIARIDNLGPVSFAVRVGYKDCLSRTSSGIVILAYMSGDVRHHIFERLRFSDDNFDEQGLSKTFENIRKIGYLKRKSRFVNGVIDISAPILSNGQIVATLTAPCITTVPDTPFNKIPVDLIKNAALNISNILTEQ